MTQQEMFNTVATALLAQGVASVDGGRCMYRGPNGTKCALGHLIPDENYSSDLEGRGATASAVREAAGLSTEEGVDLAECLQDAHDFELNNKGVGAWQRQMRVIAHRFDLDASVLD